MARRSDDAVLLELIGEVLGVLDLDELRQVLPAALMRAVPATWASLNEVGPGGVVSIVEGELEERWFAKFAELAEQNPIYQHWVRTRDGRAYRFRDVCTREELEATDLYKEMYGPLGVQDQVALTLPCPEERVLALVLTRDDGEFTDRERDFLNRARPFLIQLYRNAVAHTELRAQSAGELEVTLTAAGLTEREAQVLRLVALGGSNRDVAARLGLSDRTVQKHLERAFPKLGVRTRSEAAARAWALTTDGRARDAG